MGQAIRHGLAGLFRFTGRDGRQAFWYYVLFVYLVVTAISTAVTMPLTMRAAMTGVQQGMAQARDPAATQAAVMAQVSEIMPIIMVLGMITGVVMIVLLGAAIVRRLHDSSMPGAWALAPFVCQLVSLISMPAQIERATEAMKQIDGTNPMAGFSMMQNSASASSLVGWVAIALVVWFGVRKSTEGANRYGESPFNV